jgi:hypothetical protein
VLYRIVHNDPDEQALACADRQLRELIRRCLSKDPENRPTPEQIVAECAGLTLTEPGWLPGSIAAQAARLDAAAVALVKRAMRRRTVRRMQAAPAALILCAALFATVAAIRDGDTNRAQGGSPAADTPRSSASRPGSTAPGTSSGHTGAPSITRHQVASAFGPVGQASDAAGPLLSSTAPNPSPSLAASESATEPAFYSFEGSSEGWSAIGGADLVSSPLFHFDRRYSLGLIGAVDGGTAHLVDAAVGGLPNGPAAGTSVEAWVYVPASVAHSIQAELYVKDALGVEHESEYVSVPPGTWYRLTYATAGYGGRAHVVGVRFDESRSVGATVYLDAVSWN